MKLVTKGIAIFDRIIGVLALLAGALLIFILLSVSVEVFMRYCLNRPIIWVVEVTEYSLFYITFLGAAAVLKREGHVKVDALLNQLKPRNRSLLNLITSIAGAVICLVLVWYGARATWETFQLGYLMPSIMRPPKFVLLAIIPIGSLMLVIQFVRRAYGYLESWRTS